MQSYNNYDTIKYFIAANAGLKPPLGNVFAINGHTIDVVVRGSKVVIRNVPVSGDVSKLYINQPVSLIWNGSDCIATGVSTTASNSKAAGKLGSSFSSTAPYAPNKATIEKGSGGIRVKKHSITLDHLAFRPAVLSGLSGVGNSGGSQPISTTTIRTTVDHARTQGSGSLNNDDELFFSAVDGASYNIAVGFPYTWTYSAAMGYGFDVTGSELTTSSTEMLSYPGGVQPVMHFHIVKVGDAVVHFKWGFVGAGVVTEKAGAYLAYDSAGSSNLVNGISSGVTNGNGHDHIGGDGAPIKEGAILLSDVVTDDASTTVHGFAPKAVVPATGFINVVGIGVGETGYSNKAISTGGSGGGREVLTANRDYYVLLAGNDSASGKNNTTNPASGAFLTIQHAINIACSLDMNLFGVTIHVGPGTWPEYIMPCHYVGGWGDHYRW